jgi:hypothetical protein
MLSRSHPIILFIDRFGFSVYQDTLTSIPKFNFTQDLVSNLDVVNKEKLAELIATFIQINKIVPSSLAVILSDDIIYIKDLAVPVQKPTPGQPGTKINLSEDKDHEEDVRNFLEDVPFEVVLAKVIKAVNINRIVAVNRDLIMGIVDTFIGKGSTLEAVVPGFMYVQGANYTSGLTLENVKIILGNTETLKLGNLLTDSEKATLSSAIGNQPESSPIVSAKKPRNLRQYILVGVFVLLLVALVVVYLTLGRTPVPVVIKNRNIPAANIPAASAGAELANTQSPISTPSAALNRIKIEIIQTSQADEKAEELKSSLVSIGYVNIINEVSDVAIPEKSSIVFSQDIPSNLRNDIILEIKKIIPDISVLESQNSNSTINISIGKS